MPGRRNAHRFIVCVTPRADGPEEPVRGATRRSRVAAEAFLRPTDGDAEKPASAKKRDHMTPGHGGRGPAVSSMCDTGRAAGTCVCVLMHRVIRIRLRTRRACGGAAGGAVGNPKNRVDSRLVKSTYPVLGLQLRRERRRHDLASHAGRRGEVRLARLAPAARHGGRVLHRAALRKGRSARPMPA